MEGCRTPILTSPIRPTGDSLHVPYTPRLRSEDVIDLVLVAATVGFFLLSFALVRWFDLI